MPTPATINVALRNTTSSNNVYAFVTGRALDNNNALFLLSSDGRTPYYPSSPSDTVQPLQRDIAIPLGAVNNTVTITVPHLAGARIYFSIDAKLQFYLNPGPALVEPSVTNPSDPNLTLNWGFCEFTYNDAQIFVNISYVDFVSIPIALALTSVNSPPQSVAGMPKSGLDSVCAQLRQQDATDSAGWSQLIVQSPSNNNKPLRALSPNTAIVRNPHLFEGYYDPYVASVYSRFTSTTLRVNTQAAFGTLAGRVSPDGSTLTIGSHAFARPSAADIFSCSTGPFVELGSVERGAIIARLAAAFNRSVLLNTDIIPDGSSSAAQYYADPRTNHYARVVHAVNDSGRGYAFPYDDVAPDGGVDQSGSVFSGDPSLLTVTVGGA
ncbi:putative glucan endo-1,3-beta-glucosidase precursor [Pseudovirgaria hyperparasitica]|uniref:Putative glucan endo-1,3-beta-glucosidase n=1 Tax=Pseudovirgaria hyperparasitica TaxID=470096 RepID=A0A6A6WMT6_9PEZI|nr:putative glucan endo-1,3-beta-glucosidase precursor [Pseudovirgaria hyperparasitica]KAF2763458.1 putative glucan endo-1,3-beta-glucosidase precursor [Pseudovirgaria hyperparasitica]